jgi:hypothetical protein
MSGVSDQFWIDNLKVLFRKDRLIEFFVTCDQTTSEKLNAITRLGIYISIVLSLYFNNLNYLGLLVIIFLFTFFIYNFSDDKSETFKCNMENGESFADEKAVYTKPTINNPFMNKSVMDSPTKPLPYNYSDNTVESAKVKEKIKEAFEYNLYQDVGDLYSTNHSFRQLYTVPTEDPDGTFKDFLYGNSQSAKENTYNGYKNLYEPLQSKQEGGN